MARTKQTQRIEMRGGRSTFTMRPFGGPLVENVAQGVPIPLEPPAPMTEQQVARLEKEDRYRKIFGTDPSNYEISDPYVLLTNIYENTHKYVYEAMDAGEEAIPKLFTKFKQPHTPGEPSIVPQPTFQQNWEEFTSGVLTGLSWSNVFAAGGSVLACIQPDGMAHARSSDIDLFLWGLSSDEEANSKLREIYQVVSTNAAKAGSCEVLRTHRAITILCHFPYRHVQIILKQYKSPAEVLLGFDIDSCCVGYDGTAVWGMDERFTIAINKGYNLINSSRRSLTYETRLFKYAKRGFVVAVPNLDKARVDHSLFHKSTQNTNGLQKLLIFEYQTLHPQDHIHVSYTASLRRMLCFGRVAAKNDSELLADKIEEYAAHEANNPSDYSEVFIPWGPRWRPDTILRVLQLRDRAEFFRGVNSAKGGPKMKSKLNVEHRHCFVAGIEDVIAGHANMYWCNLCKTKTPLSGEENGKYISGPLTWVSQGNVYQDCDKGFRRTLHGSWHPVLEVPFDENIYLKDGQRSSLSPHPLQHINQPDGTASFPIVQTQSATQSNLKQTFMCQTCSAIMPTQNALNLHEREAHLKTTDFKPFGSATSLFSAKTGSPTPAPSGFGGFSSKPANAWGSPQQSAFTTTSTSPFAAQPATSGFGTTSPFGSPSAFGTQASSPFGAQPSPSSPFGTQPGTSLFGPPQPPQQAQQKITSFFPQPSTTSQPNPFGAPSQLPTQKQPQPRFKQTTPLQTIPTSAQSSAVAPLPGNMAASLSQLTDKVSKLLYLVAQCSRSNLITADVKSTLKDMIINNNTFNMCCALEVFELDHDINELADTLKLVAQKKF
ncbi:ankyrin repeat protein [Pelomyxa schiedti]|nr:ankyrin repeat protein [Pelomyxa schiedti]